MAGLNVIRGSNLLGIWVRMRLSPRMRYTLMTWYEYYSFFGSLFAFTKVKSLRVLIVDVISLTEPEVSHSGLLIKLNESLRIFVTF